MRLIDADRMKSNTPNWLLETDGVRKRMLYDELDWQPTISEAEIIRKAFERVLEKLGDYTMWKKEMIYDFTFRERAIIKHAIEIVKEECGINE